MDHEEVSRHTHPTAPSSNDPAAPKGSNLLDQQFPSRPGVGYWVCLRTLPLEGGKWKRKKGVNPLQGEWCRGRPSSSSHVEETNHCPKKIGTLLVMAAESPWRERVTARTDPAPGRDSTGGGDSGEDTSTSVPIALYRALYRCLWSLRRRVTWFLQWLQPTP